ncbi:hypothetical protein EVJ24_00385 [Exiguobacterium sp. SH1S21]|nr:hypothetical protein EVJ24_00385 [Exiguobacterium sp. SH1S21]
MYDIIVSKLIKVKRVIKVDKNSYIERQKQVKFAVGMAAIDGGKPSPFTQKLLNRYENGEITSAQFKQAIMEQYTKAHQS